MAALADRLPNPRISISIFLCWHMALSFRCRAAAQARLKTHKAPIINAPAYLLRLPWFYAFSLSYFALLSFFCLRKGVHSPVSCYVLPPSAWLFCFTPNIWQRAKIVLYPQNKARAKSSPALTLRIYKTKRERCHKQRSQKSYKSL